MNREEFIYLAEMELKTCESGRSTRFLKNQNYEFLDKSLFRDFLKLTAIQNGWPSVKNRKIKEKKFKPMREKVFSQLFMTGITHPATKSKDKKIKKSISVPVCPNHWANNILDKIDELLSS